MWSIFSYIFIVILIVTIGVEAVMIFDQEIRIKKMRDQVHETTLRVDATIWRADMVLKAQEQLLFGTCTATSTK